MEITRFNEKLNYLKSVYKVTDGEIGDNVGAAKSLVCRWRSGERTLDRYRDSYTAGQLAEFFIGRAVVQNGRQKLAEILALNEADIELKSEKCIGTLLDFLYNEQSLVVNESEENKNMPGPQNRAGSFIGVRGVLDALITLEEKTRDRSGADVTVYLSLEYSRLLQDDTAAEILELLYRINRNSPVQIVFDGWLDNTEKAAQNFRILLPFLQSGKIRLSMIKSTQKFFYYNLTFFARGAGMVITTEPAGGMGVSISLLTDSREYMAGMSSVFADFDKIAKNLARHVTPKEGAVYYAKLFDPPEDLQTLSDGLNLLYLDEGSYLSLLKLNQIKGSARTYRHAKFIEDKRRYDAFLGGNRIKEIVCLTALDRMISDNEIKTPDFPFQNGRIAADKTILKRYIEGLLRYIEQYENLTVYLERGESFGFTGRIKGDSFVLLHTQETGQEHTVYSDNWMLVYEYIKQFNEVMQSDSLINIKASVKTALQMRLDKLK